jgi:peptidoglycan/xylan/chitin deacetylase (PgdA/CDA1 family)
VVYPGLAAAGYFRSQTRPGLAVITYHGVLPSGYKPIDPGFDGSLITADVFRQQLRLLKAKYNVITPEEMRFWCQRSGELPPRAALLTCDDGFLNNLTEMVPVLQDEGLKCLFFVTGGSLGDQRAMLWYEDMQLLFLRAPAGMFQLCSEGIEISGVFADREQRRALWWNAVKQLSQVDAESRERFLRTAYAYLGMEESLPFYLATYAETQRHFCLLRLSELQQVAAAGMTIGAHTLTHPLLSQMPPERAWTEIAESRSQLESALGREIWAFAYPFGGAGSVTPRIVAMTKQAGFEAAFMNADGGLGSSLPLQAIPRVHVNAGMSLAEFEAHVSGFYGSLQRALRRTAEPDLPEINPLPSAPPDLRVA